jgi:AraC-like DNA-binding protein
MSPDVLMLRGSGRKTVKRALSHEAHLVIKQVALLPGEEWCPTFPGWSFVQLVAGMGYWLHPRHPQDLAKGTVLILSQFSAGAIRASQLGTVRLNVFRVEPDRLTGLVTLGEQLFLRAALARETFCCRVVPSTDPLAEQYQKLSVAAEQGPFRARVQMLQIFVDSFGDELNSPRPEPATVPDAKQRLAELLKQTPAAELLELRLDELVDNTHCTPRHLSRVFHEVVGMSFRDKKAELRLGKAKELLAGTDRKVSDVALESGYPSVGVLNVAFKQQFGISPARWRQQLKNRSGSGRLTSVMQARRKRV